jgi:hypothetical protein
MMNHSQHRAGARVLHFSRVLRGFCDAFHDLTGSIGGSIIHGDYFKVVVPNGEQAG